MPNRQDFHGAKNKRLSIHFSRRYVKLPRSFLLLFPFFKSKRTPSAVTFNSFNTCFVQDFRLRISNADRGDFRGEKCDGTSKKFAVFAIKKLDPICCVRASQKCVKAILHSESEKIERGLYKVNLKNRLSWVKSYGWFIGL